MHQTAGWNILGHEWAVKMLDKQIARNEMSHAYLITGMPQVGRRTLALRFAQAINCTLSKTVGQPCGACKNCLRIEKMQHPDLSIVQAENEGGNLKVEQIRQLQHTLSLTPYEARWRVALLLRFEEANANAQNALLKTLEEAPPSVILLLTASTAENLLPTIVSRCEQLRLRPLSVEDLQVAMEKTWNVTHNDALRIAHLAQGRVGSARRMVAAPDLILQQSGLAEDLFQLLGASRRARFAYAEQAVKSIYANRDRSSLRLLLQVWLSCWRDLFIEASGAAIPAVNLDYKETFARLALKIDLNTIRLNMVGLEHSMTLLDTTNANPQMLLDSLLLDFPLI